MSRFINKMKILLDIPKLKNVGLTNRQVKAPSMVGYEWKFKYEIEAVSQTNTIQNKEMPDDISTLIYNSKGDRPNIHTVKAQLEKLGCEILSVSNPANQSALFRIEFKQIKGKRFS